jgi:hypothetical protein
MARRPRGRNLERWEVALVKAMLARGGYDYQDILAYFTRPTRSINHRVISEIRNGVHHATLRVASDEALDEFLAAWPEVDQQTGLSLRGDELLIKAREAMIAAVHIFNSAGLHFRAELFIVTTIIAWAYLLHAYYRRQGIDYRYYKNVDGVREIDTTAHGADKFWELGRCLRDERCPLVEGVIQNLEFLLELRHEIEHRSTSRIDESVSAKLQACCINFNEAIKTRDQAALLKRASDLPEHIETMMTAFHDRLTPEQRANPQFAYRVAFVPKIVNRPGTADVAVEFVRPESDVAAEINRVLLKEVEKPKYRPGQIVTMMRAEGYPRFNMRHHTELWRSLDAQNPTKAFGVRMLDGTWYWYETWLSRVRAHCEENADMYR